MDWREDFLIENVMYYYKNKYIRQKGDDSKKEEIKKELLGLFPESLVSVGEPISQKQEEKGFHVYIDENVKSLD